MRLTPSVVLLVVANLLPLAGVLWWGWSVFLVMLLFWLENIIVGLLNIPRILFALGGEQSGSFPFLNRLFTAAFFSFHYGMFTFAHGTFVFSMFAEGDYRDPEPDQIFHLIMEQQLYWAVLALFISHFASLVINYFISGEYKLATVKEMMKKPYSRIVVLHLSIIFGGILLDLLSVPLAGLIVLLLVKIYFDVRSHLREHKKLEEQAHTETQSGY